MRKVIIYRGGGSSTSTIVRPHEAPAPFFGKMEKAFNGMLDPKIDGLAIALNVDADYVELEPS